MIMESSLPSYDDEFPRGDLSKTYSLELAYQESIRKSDFIIQDEAARRLRLQILLLEDDNDELHEQLAIEDDRIDELEQDCAELQRQVEQAEATSHRYETELRIKGRELSNLKAELSSMNGLSTDSTKLLTEKLSLARELATLKTELEHLRSQANYQQTVLAEKLALQRQVSTLEVELETEKRASKRAGHKDKGCDTEIELQKEVEELRKELSRERREKEKAQKAEDKGSTEWESRKAVLESKVEQLRTKLRESKEQVKELQTDLAQAQAAITKASATATNSGDSVKPARKRTANQISTDSMIGTPDGVAARGKRPATKSGKPDQTSLGEKSMFSITPYLNRTLSVAPETPRHEPEPEVNNGHEAETNGQTPTVDLPQLAAEKETPQGNKDASTLAVLQLQQKKKTKEKTILTEAKNTVINTKAPQKKMRMVGTLEKVTEEEVDENVEPPSITATLASMKPSMQNQVPGAGGAEPKKKKRKLLGSAKTIFDEDDGEATKRPAKINLGPARSLAKGQSIGSKGGLQSGLSGNARGFGAFSPLKKDKRGAQASFLA